jgi:hypothetical protein
MVAINHLLCAFAGIATSFQFMRSAYGLLRIAFHYNQSNAVAALIS